MHNFFYKIILSFTLSLFVYVQNISAQPLPARLYTNALEVKVGDTIRLQLKVNPKPEKPIFTVSSSLMYDPSILQYMSSNFSDSVFMLPVPRAPYSLEDTENGMIRRTAGYTNGVDTLVGFTEYEFKALKPGDAKISIEDGVALDIDNIDIGLQQKELTIHILDKDTATSTESTSTNFDVKLNLDILGPVAIYKEEGYVFPIDQIANNLLGTTTVKVFVYNNKTELFFSEEKTFFPNTNEPIAFTIPANTLVEGGYVISAEIQGEDGFPEIIAQKEIGVLSNHSNWVTDNRDWLLPLFLFIVVIAIIHHISVDRGIYTKIKQIRRKKRRNIRA